MTLGLLPYFSEPQRFLNTYQMELVQFLLHSLIFSLKWNNECETLAGVPGTHYWLHQCDLVGPLPEPV